MNISRDHQFLLTLLGISEERLKAINLDPQIIDDIMQDYAKSQEDLNDSAEYIAKKLQRCNQVHSVRWRVKDVSHLIEKIIRKKEAQSKKYEDINVTNYKSKIDDLIGIRAIYLFKHDWLPVYKHILSKWTPKEKVTIYHREGDDLEQYVNQPDCETKQHNDSYRSIHYIIPATEEFSCEIQTRTIFEEAWSEIDHKVRYPSFSEDPYLKQFLNIFNRLAGSADEMGSYVVQLVEFIKESEKQNKIVEKSQMEIQELQIQLSNLIEQNKDYEEVKKLNRRLKKLISQNDSSVPSRGLELFGRPTIGSTSDKNIIIGSTTRRLGEALGLTIGNIEK